MITYVDGEVSTLPLMGKVQICIRSALRILQNIFFKMQLFHAWLLIHVYLLCIFRKTACQLSNPTKTVICAVVETFSHPSIMLQEERSRPCDLPMSTLWDLFANAHYKNFFCPIKIADGKGMRFKMPKPLLLELLFYWIWNAIELKHKIATMRHVGCL